MGVVLYYHHRHLVVCALCTEHATVWSMRIVISYYGGAMGVLSVKSARLDISVVASNLSVSSLSLSLLAVHIKFT